MLVLRKVHPLFFFTLAGFFILIILPLTREGMFLDGVIYAALAKNLSLGLGSLWTPFYAKLHFSEFYEHPPLALFFQSLFFKFFTYAPERIYCFFLASTQLAIIYYWWIRHQDFKTKLPWALGNLSYLLFIWLTIPLNYLYTQNMLETSLTLFSTTASLLILTNNTSIRSLVLRYNLAAFAIIIGFFCNGPTAFAPLATPFIYSLIMKSGKKCSTSLCFGFIVFFDFALVYYFLPEALANTRHYFAQQLIPAVLGDRQPLYVGFKHLHILYLFLRAYLGISLLMLALVILTAKLEEQSILERLITRLKNPNFQLFFLLALLASLPIGISHRQAFNYLLPSAPFYTLSMMYFGFEDFIGFFRYLKNHYYIRFLQNISYLVIITSSIALISLAGGYNRQKDLLEDIKFLVKYFNNSESISLSPRLYYSWYTEAYFCRYSLLSLNLQSGETYYLAEKSENLLPKYKKLNLPLKYYQLASSIS